MTTAVEATIAADIAVIKIYRVDATIEDWMEQVCKISPAKTIPYSIYKFCLNFIQYFPANFRYNIYKKHPL